ncbi:MAG: glyoxalase/bleomycin resistance/dioxygenase family protein [Motiliproteus sp.]
MDIQRTGIILNTENYDACVVFYRELFNLPVMFEKIEGDFRLTCLGFGGSYLMVETEGYAKPAGKTLAENATKLRFNVADLELVRQRILAFGLDAEIINSSWGSTINIVDPDGNRVGIRDESGFAKQCGA